MRHQPPISPPHLTYRDLVFRSLALRASNTNRGEYNIFDMCLWWLPWHRFRRILYRLNPAHNFYYQTNWYKSRQNFRRRSHPSKVISARRP